jgi:formylglycine-generating enzyme required for sulfatase activity
VRGRIFINYRRVESLNQAQHLKTLFDKAFGAKRVFLDVRGIDGGENWLQTLERQVAACDAMVVLIGKEWANLRDEHGNRRLDDPHDKVRFEISQALLRNLPIVPVSIDGAAIPKAAQLPDNLMQLALIQAMPLRAESFPQDAAAITERLRVLLAKLHQRGIPMWSAGLGFLAALAAGIAAGPMILNQLGLRPLGVALPGDDQSRRSLAEMRQRVDDAEKGARAADQRLAQAELSAKSAETVHQSTLQRLSATEKERDSVSERLAVAQKERDEARTEAASVNGKIRDLEARMTPATPVRRLGTLEPSPAAPTLRRLGSLQPTPAAAVRDTIRDCSDCPEMVVVPAGKFMMGSADGDATEKPVHEVTIPQAFAVGKYEVTFAEWEACVAGGGCLSNKSPNDRGWGKGRRPVINVSWSDAKEYVSWLSRKTGQSYRLLTEAEWEYAARAGSSSAYAWGDNIGTGNANCNGCGSQWDNQRTAPVGSFAPNAFGLHDMHGNVWEWCEDNWHADYSGSPPADGLAWQGGDSSLRIQRGGSWYSNPPILRSANRGWVGPGVRIDNIGFRVARTL